MASEFALGQSKQQLNNGEVHRWYRFVLAFPDHLVQEMLARFGVTERDLILDPFCGTGTTLVECKKLGFNAVGIDANPSSAFASRVKTEWNVDPNKLITAADSILRQLERPLQILSDSRLPLFKKDGDVTKSLKAKLLEASPAGQYIVASKMLERKWIGEIPFFKSLALQQAIESAAIDADYKDVLRLALVAILVENVSNVGFGPEIFVTKDQADCDVGGYFHDKVNQIAADLRAVGQLPRAGNIRVFAGDARVCADVLREAGINRIDFVVTSPPYPTEKDYTRQTRLELAYLGLVQDAETLRRIKHQMIRSHSKGIYKSDIDGRSVAHIPEVKAIADELRRKTRDKTYGFAKLYPRIIEEYFGGMYRHLQSLASVLRSGGACAYVVGEQRTYLQTYTPTARILGIIAEQQDIGLKVEDIVTWRVRRGTTGSGEPIREEILILRKP
jgi:DNA modification methylase